MSKSTKIVLKSVHKALGDGVGNILGGLWEGLVANLAPNWHQKLKNERSKMESKKWSSKSHASQYHYWSFQAESLDRMYIFEHLWVLVDLKKYTDSYMHLLIIHIYWSTNIWTQMLYFFCIELVNFRKRRYQLFFWSCNEKSIQKPYQNQPKWLPNRSTKLSIFGVDSILGGLWEGLEPNLAPRWFPGLKSESFDPLLAAILEAKIDQKSILILS